MTRLATLALVSSIALLAAGCERGCANRWVREKKDAVGLPSAFAPALDCPDGLARCVGGVVEASKLARIPQPCSKTEGRGDCACPWVPIAECPHGCLAEGAVIDDTPDRAVARLCFDPESPRDAASLEEDEGDAETQR